MRKGGHETVPALFLPHLSGHNSEYYSLMYFLAMDERRKMPPQRIYNAFCLNVSPKSVQRASVVFAFQCLLVWAVEMLPLRHGLAEKRRLQERQLQNCFEMLQNK